MDVKEKRVGTGIVIKDYSDAKIALSIAIKEIINNGLNILGIGCPEKM